MWNVLAKMLYRQPSTHVGLDISSGSVKIAEVANQKGFFVLNQIGVADIPESIVQENGFANKEELGALIRNLMGTSGITCREVTAGLGGRNVFSRELSMPKMEEKEMKEALKWDIGQYVPFPPDTYYYDFAVLEPNEGATEVKVLVVAAPRENVDYLRDVCRIAELNLQAVDFEALALKRTLASQENIMIVDIGTEVCQVVVYRDSYPALVRTIPIGGRQFTGIIMDVLNLTFREAEAFKVKERNLLPQLKESEEEIPELQQQMKILADELGREIRRTLEYYQMQNSQGKITPIYLTGGGALIDRLAIAVNTHINIPVVKHDPFSQFRTAAYYDQQYIDDVDSRLAIAVGLGLRGVRNGN